ncbi:sulfite exporter TauE/SafE family protein [Fluoribacter dumoffii]|uniref:Sulfite exporter TauE/SafE n=1 Tax=Fluoribacter dumoffii TaxID=463 RepID=A0A377G5A0_9GAMM|nr:sulfite exporter TauE/SafE family protein [Fluoribacter dumoffii]KTC91511.1 integral membrane protein [Fluoribacter dumoffii NY 23]MCW8387366.1 sulfite exporter TauE/SafE family protein [Fluoribacter dumoffii]MCW8417127.1 sulfite exporter TauE/SafE family protein [Fluoribacter dumoffii]MCW8455033.1 sulfite exporter TauE/SafE family protein [Fluoribacter dumoffii]MCW8460890.1 sulfite exporter TauE/SafE family protein [Fluoribacter dumoffii]
MVIFFITLSILVLSLLCVAVMVFKLFRQPAEPLSLMQYLKLGISGVIAFIADTLGIGSFAVNVTLAKMMGTFRDDEMPAVNNGAQVIPGTIESLFFMGLIDVDLTTLLTLVMGTCVGGLLGGFVVSHLSKQAIRLAMICCFALIILLLISHQFRLLPVGGELTELSSWKLIIGFLAMVVCGALTSVGVGLFVMVQGVLFLMNISPAVAFPIMTTAGAMQQPLTTLVFLKHNKIPLKKTLILSLSGCLGVLITIPVFMQLTITWLHLLLLFILIYNFFAVGRSYLQSRPSKNFVQTPRPSPLVAAE